MPSAGEGHTIIGLDAEEPETDSDAEPGVATLQVRHEQSGQWVQSEGCASGATDTISCRAAGEVGCKGTCEGDRLLVRVRSPDKVAKEQFTVFNVVEADNPPLQRFALKPDKFASLSVGGSGPLTARAYFIKLFVLDIPSLSPTLTTRTPP